MSKTPISDKIQKYLSILEKLNFSTKLDTGYDTSAYVQNAKQAGQDFDEFFGVGDFKKKHGDPAATLSPNTWRSESSRAVSRRVAKALFSDKTLAVPITLLHVKQSNNIAQENISPYIWKTNIFELLQEDTKTETKAEPEPISRSNNMYWRLDDSGLIYIKRVKPMCQGFYYAAAESVKLGSFIHGTYGDAPRPAFGPSRNLQQYSLANYKEHLVQAIERIKTFVKDPDSQAALDGLKTCELHELPVVIADSILIGMADAASLKISKKQEGVGNKANIGWQILAPDMAAPSLESIITQTQNWAPGDSFLTDEIKHFLTQVLAQVSQRANPYEDGFEKTLKDSLVIKKLNVGILAEKTATTVYFTLAALVNQLSRIFKRDFSSVAEAAKLYFGKLGWDPKRSDELKETLQNSFINTNLPISVIRVLIPEDSSDYVLTIDSHVVDIDISSKKRSFDVGKLKQLGLPSIIHSHVLNQCRSKYKNINKDSYITEFNKIQDRASSIPNTIPGKPMWLELLNTCYKDDGSFVGGVSFVGLSPIFWDAPHGFDIRVAVKKDVIDVAKLPYLLGSGSNKYGSVDDGYVINKAIEIYYDRVVDLDSKGNVRLDRKTGKPVISGDVEEVDKIAIKNKIIEKRSKYIIDNFDFLSLADIREEILTKLYNLETSSQAHLASIAIEYAWYIYKNTESGFWSFDGGKTLACYNPWVYGEKGQTTKLRFFKENTNDTARAQGIERARSAYVKSVEGKG